VKNTELKARFDCMCGSPYHGLVINYDSEWSIIWIDLVSFKMPFVRRIGAAIRTLLGHDYTYHNIVIDEKNWKEIAKFAIKVQRGIDLKHEYIAERITTNATQ